MPLGRGEGKEKRLLRVVARGSQIPPPLLDHRSLTRLGGEGDGATRQCFFATSLFTSVEWGIKAQVKKSETACPNNL